MELNLARYTIMSKLLYINDTWKMHIMQMHTSYSWHFKR